MFGFQLQLCVASFFVGWFLSSWPFLPPHLAPGMLRGDVWPLWALRITPRKWLKTASWFTFVKLCHLGAPSKWLYTSLWSTVLSQQNTCQSRAVSARRQRGIFSWKWSVQRLEKQNYGTSPKRNGWKFVSTPELPGKRSLKTSRSVLSDTHVWSNVTPNSGLLGIFEAPKGLQRHRHIWILRYQPTTMKSSSCKPFCKTR